MATLTDRLEAIDAPDALVEWTRGFDDVDAAWESCRRGAHRVWLAVIAGAPIEALLEAGAAALLEAEERFSLRSPAVATAIDAALEGADAATLIEAAEACESLSEGGSAGYREAMPPGYEAIARGAALLARAAEALAAAEAIREARVLEEARHRAATLGIGAQAALPSRDGPARLEQLSAAGDPAQGNLLFCVAACAQAVLDAQDAVVTAGTPTREAEAALDAVTREALTAYDE